MVSTNRKFVTVAAIAFATFIAGSNARAQGTSEPLVSAASLQGIQQQLNALKTQVTVLQSSNASLQASNTALQSQVKSLQTGNATLESQVGTLQSQLAILQANPALALGPFVRVDPRPEVGVAGPNVVFHGVNVHLVSGSGTTNDNGAPRGLGNLILGYDEDPAQVNEGVLQAGDRGGSHNLIIGRYHRFTQAAFGGLVAGEINTLRNGGASVTGGTGNTASGADSSVSGGNLNTASGTLATVAGGDANIASGELSSISGGVAGTASGTAASITGGQSNSALEPYSTVLGGNGNEANAQDNVVLGGINVVGRNQAGIAPQPPFP